MQLFVLKAATKATDMLNHQSNAHSFLRRHLQSNLLHLWDVEQRLQVFGDQVPLLLGHLVTVELLETVDTGS